MRKLGWLLFVISLLGSTGLAVAQMQPQTTPQTTPNTSASAAPATTTTKTVPVNTVGTAGQPNFGQVIASVNNPRSAIAKVRSVNGGSANNLRPINVAAISGADPAALSTAVSKNQGPLNALRNALNRTMVTTTTNERISIAQFLADNRITLSQVVGADMSNGMLLLYYQK
jgi:hypothetical protein